MTTAHPAAGTSLSGGAPAAPDDISTAQRRIRPGRIAVVVLLLVLAAQFVNFLVTNDRLRWHVVGEFLFDDLVLHGLLVTIELTAIGMVLGIAIGIAVAAARMSSFRPLSTAAWAYTRFFYGVPLLVQLIFWFNLAYLVPEISIGIPFGPSFGSWDANEIITPFTAAVLGLALHEGGYMSEVVRAGLLSVDRGQRDAASALALRGHQTFRLIVLPQALRFMIPPTVNQTIGMLKGTALVSTVAVSELLHEVQNIYNRNFEVIPLLLVACIWYFALISVLDLLQRYLERRLGRADSTPTRPTRGLRRRRAEQVVASREAEL
ncbi:amino acid ABC transporter permease [Blastococcus sp. SYSU D00669]